MKATSSVLAALLLPALLAGCGGGSDPGGPSAPARPVAIPPSITSQPTSLAVQQGDAAAFTVVASGTRPMTYAWTKDGADIDGATAATLRIASARPGDAGSYSVTVANAAGRVTSTAATLTVADGTLPDGRFDFHRELLGAPGTLTAAVADVDPASRQVTINGGDVRGPTAPFTFDWGDGSASTGFFPQTHVYADGTRNYLARVTAHYSPGESDVFEVPVLIAPTLLTPTAFPASLAVTIPANPPALTSRQSDYLSPANLTGFADAFFDAVHRRDHLEYVLSQAARIGHEIMEGDVEPVDGAFRQVVLRDPQASGAFSLWFTSPVAIGAGDAFLRGTPGYSSLFHEISHNLTLNAPAAFRYGGRIDGNANAIFSEAVAQMFQHVIAYEMLNDRAKYGIPDDLALEIASSARASMRILRSAHDAYIAQGMPFSTWNDPVTPSDETFGTFMTVARQFLVHAENAESYGAPLTRTMRLLRTFDAAMLSRYAPAANDAAASAFRATLMVAAVSYGFERDLRSEFRQLGFPIDDAAYTDLYGSVP